MTEEELNKMFQPRKGVSEEDFKKVAPTLFEMVNEDIKANSYTNNNGLFIYNDRVSDGVRVSNGKMKLSHLFRRHDLPWKNRHFKCDFFQNMTIAELFAECLPNN